MSKNRPSEDGTPKPDDFSPNSGTGGPPGGFSPSPSSQPGESFRADVNERMGLSDSVSASISGVGNVKTSGAKMRARASVKANAKVSAPFSTEFRREAVEQELRFDIDTQARALAHVFQTAVGEFCFAIFGTWGRGKTTLLQRLKRVLAEPLVDGYTNYQFIDFSAWKYRSTPECWVFLYESAVQASALRGCWSAMLTSIRANLIKHGIWPLAFAAMLFAWAVTPLQLRLSAAIEVLQATGLFAALLLFSVYVGAQRSGLTGHLKNLVALSRHREKLGLQATIGIDLRSLIIGWVPLDAFNRGWIFWTGVASYFLSVVAGAAIVQTRIWEVLWRDSSDGWTWLVLLPISVLILLWVLFSLVVINDIFRTTSSSSQRLRILLCVDDLDRCEPDVMLEIVEALKLLLDDPEISRRLQVVVLLDRKILETAIQFRILQP